MESKISNINIENLSNNLIRELTDNNKLFNSKKLIRGLLNRKIILNDISFWPNSLIIYYFSLLNDNNANELIIRQFSLWKKKKFKIHNFDDILMAYIFMRREDLFSKRELNDLLVSVNDSIADYKGKSIPYRPDYSDDIFIDILGMIPPYLCLYGINYEKKEYINWALTMFDDFFKYGMSEKYNLPYHAFSNETKEKKGIIGWGRSLGWMLFGLSESIAILHNNSNNNYKSLLNKYYEMLDKSLSYIRTDGGFSWQLFSIDGHLDTSATSLILLSMLTLKNERILDEKYDFVITNIFNCLCKNIKYDKVINCLSECRGLGMYPQIYDSYSWSVAPTLSCIYYMIRYYNI
ncbi:MAG: hypothetical protein E7170_01125 [Firmicutes bacterium]|nr:hypothetical protein [Bacillota bacterium]